VSKAARRPAAPENQDYFRGPVNAAGRARVALQVLSLAQDIDFTNKKAIFSRDPPLQETYRRNPLF